MIRYTRCTVNRQERSSIQKWVNESDDTLVQKIHSTSATIEAHMAVEIRTMPGVAADRGAT